MNLIECEWKKQSPNEVQFLPTRQIFQQESPEKKSDVKRVRFKFQTPSPQQQACEITEKNHMETIESKEFIFQGPYFISSSEANIFRYA
jgi:hypothetical protein